MRNLISEFIYYVLSKFLCKTPHISPPPVNKPTLCISPWANTHIRKHLFFTTKISGQPQNLRKKPISKIGRKMEILTNRTHNVIKPLVVGVTREHHYNHYVFGVA